MSVEGSTNNGDGLGARFFMARQPIYDAGFRLQAYELLYRNEISAQEANIGPDQELRALANVLVEVGLDRLVGQTTAFINLPVGLMGSDALKLLPQDRVILEVLEDTPWTPEVEAHLLDLRSCGYKLALDDYTFEARHDPFLSLVDIVKVDVMGINHDQLRAGMTKADRRLRKYLAEKVEMPEEFEVCKHLGFDLFQGYFFSKPNTVRGSGIPANQELSLSLLARLQNPDISMDDLEKLIVSNVALCHKILRLVNSASMGLRREIDSIRQAVMFLGSERIRTLATLAVMTAVAGKPPELYNLAMTRAKYCEMLAQSIPFESPQKHFIVGLLSVLDALTDMPMDEVIKELPLCAEISDALRGVAEATPCSQTLQHVLSVERGEWGKAESNLPGAPRNLYVDSVEWAEEQQRLLAA